MTRLTTVSSRLRSLRAAALAAVVACHSSFVLAAAPVAVAAIQPTRTADLVLVSAGFNAGLRQGMICRVTRGGTEVAEVLLVDLRPTCASALIVAQTPGQSIRAGDLASVKILKAQS